MIITNMQVNHLVNPLGYAMGSPSFSWNYEGSSEEKVVNSRIVVYCGHEVIADTGEAQLNYLGTVMQLSLCPRTRYTWRVYAALEDGNTVVSGEQWFETGKMEETWTAQWITAEESDRHPIFQKNIELKGKPHKARMYIIGLGLFEPAVNGRKITDEILMPYCYAYDRWQQALTFDITDYLRGNDEISIMLGNGWYRGRFGFDAGNTKPAYGETMKLLCEIHIMYEDGSEEVINSDESWKVKRSNIVFSNIYDGEIVDDTLAETGEEKAMVCNEACSDIFDRYSLPVIPHEAFHPCVIRTPKGENVLDLGQNIAGIFTFNVNVPSGNTVHLQFGEVLQDGNFYRDNLRTAKAEYTYISNGLPAVIAPHFTFYGYRYVKVEGIEKVNSEDFTGYAIYSDFSEAGTLKTGNEKVNQLISNARWGMKDNFVDVPTDCPQRDERMGWTGDAQVFSQTAMYLADTSAFYKKYLFDMYQEQQHLNGMVPFTVPSVHIHQAAAVWGDAAVLIPYYQYLYNGDIKVLLDAYDSMKMWVDYIHETDGDEHGWRKQFHFGDWLALDGPKGPEAVTGRTDEGFIADVYYAKSSRIAAEAARLLSKYEDAEYYNRLADKIREELLHDYYTGSGRCAVMTMTGQILSLQEGLGDPEQAAALLKKLLQFNQGRLETGFVGTPLLCPVLSEFGMSDLAYNLLLNEEYPGWLYEVNLGATTIWERWNSLDENGRITGIGMNSLNHYSYGSIVQWLFANSAGLKPLKPGFEKVSIKPEIDHRLGFMDCTYQSRSGIYRVYWKIIDRYHIHMEWSVPFGCTAVVELPVYKESTDALSARFDGNSAVFGQGEYAITYTAVEPTDGIITLKAIVKDALKNEKIKEYLESIPLFEQSEFSFMDLTILESLASCKVTKDDYRKIEDDLIALQ